VVPAGSTLTRTPKLINQRPRGAPRTVTYPRLARPAGRVNPCLPGDDARLTGLGVWLRTLLAPDARIAA
jgi:hypothetical protein